MTLLPFPASTSQSQNSKPQPTTAKEIQVEFEKEQAKWQVQKPSSADRTVLANKAAVSIGIVNKPGLKMPFGSVSDLAARKAELLKKEGEIRKLAVSY